MGVCSNWGFWVDALCDGERSMEQDWVWSGLTSVGVVGEHNAVGWSCVGHMILEGFYVPEPM